MKKNVPWLSEKPDSGKEIVEARQDDNPPGLFVGHIHADTKEAKPCSQTNFFDPFILTPSSKKGTSKEQNSAHKKRSSDILIAGNVLGKQKKYTEYCHT